MLVLSHYQVSPVLQARVEGKSSAITSPDLGLTTVEARLRPDGFQFPDGAQVSWGDAEKIAGTENGSFLIGQNGIDKIQVFSRETNRLYSLYPTPRAPTMLISGIPMHRIKGTDPWQDTLAKIKTIAPVTGRVLDTATGLGYTAIAAAETAEAIVTVELDPAAWEIARLNPWSQPLFSNPRIERRSGDIFEIVEEFSPASFSRIIHDPPMFNLAGDLYSEEFYRNLFRVLRRGGKLFHYVGDLAGRSGRNVVRGVIARLRRAGFIRVARRPEAFGLAALKP
jgi:uncharacterized protein